MSVYATNTFSTRPGCAQDLIDALTRVLPETLEHGGCELIRILHDQDDPDSVLAITRWMTRAHYEDYLTWRAETGLTASLRTMLTEPMKVAYYDTAFTVDAELDDHMS